MSNNKPQEQRKQTQQHMQTSSGLTRYRSAPSSYFTAVLNTRTDGGDGGFGADDFAQLFNPRASSPETQRIFSRFMNSSSADTVVVEGNNYSNATSTQSLLPPPKLEEYNSQQQPPPPQRLQRQQSNDYSSSASQMMYRSHNSEENFQNKTWGSFAASPVGQIKIEAAAGGGEGNSRLIRHSSSPAGFLASINVEAEFGGARGSGIPKYGGGNNANNAEASFSSANRLNSQISFSSSSSRIMHPISETGDIIVGDNTPPGQNFDESRGNEDSYIADYINSWDDSDNFLEGLVDKDSKPFSNPDDQQNEGMKNRPMTMLSHHLSLPKNTSAELSMEKFLQETVPCKIRAKRGCATHPRSIAERVRRTKISERIRKLQELVPNMEKQTSTSDMLDLAVDYIKDLQSQVKTLSDSRDNCSCTAKQR